MEVYMNHKGEMENLDVGNLKIKANNSNIYELDRGVYFKKYLSKTWEDVRMNYDVFKKLKEINSPFTNRILEIYYSSVIKKEDFLKSPNNCVSLAYKYEFLEEEPRDLLKESTEYLLYNVKELEELILHQFVECNISAYDLKRENSVFSDGRIVLIDLDCCCLEALNKESNLDLNFSRLYYLLFDLLEKSPSFTINYLGRIDQLLWFENNDKSIYNILSRRLCKYKTPLDYIRSER